MDVVPIARLEAFRALKLSRLECFRALKFIGQIERLHGPKTLQIGEFWDPKILKIGVF